MDIAYISILIAAWIAVESGGNDLAVNGDCVGCLQIRPILVEDCNRILGQKRFVISKDYDCRLSRAESVAMAQVVIGHYKPKTIKAATMRWVSGNRAPGPRARQHWEKVMKELAMIRKTKTGVIPGGQKEKAYVLAGGATCAL